MTKKNSSSTKVIKRETYDRIVVKAQYPTGGSVELRINRNSESLVVGGSNDPELSRHQAKVIQKWSDYLPGESNKQRAGRVADMLGRYQSVGALVEALEGKPSA